MRACFRSPARRASRSRRRWVSRSVGSSFRLCCEPVERVHAQRAVRAVVRVLVGQPAQHQRSAALAGGRLAQQLHQMQPLVFGILGPQLQLGRERQHPRLIGRVERPEPGPEGVQPLRRVRQQPQRQGPRRAVGQQASVTLQQIEQFGGRRCHRAGTCHQLQHQRALRQRAALELEHQRAAGVVQRAQTGKPLGVRHQADPKRLQQGPAWAPHGHPRQARRSRGRVGGQQCQSLQQRAQLAVGGAKRDALQRGLKRRRVALRAALRTSGNCLAGCGAVAQALGRQTGQQMIRCHEHGGREFCGGLLALRCRQLVHRRQQAQRVLDLAGLHAASPHRGRPAAAPGRPRRACATAPAPP